ncbi:MAG: FN3 associated domain-containing protein [Paludibacteraceae bacterium]
MKKIFSFFAAILFAGSMMAESISITPTSGFKSAYGSEAYTFTIGEVEFACSGAMYNGKGSPTGYASKQFIQFRKSGSGAGELKNNTELNLKSITVATQSDKAFTLSAGTVSGTLSPIDKPAGTAGKYACKNNNDADIEADVTIYTFDVEGMKYFDILNGSNANYIAYVTIELGSATDVAKPTFTTAEEMFANSLNVKLTCATTGATIYYTLDETEPSAGSTLYTDAGIDISNTTTIKAIAIKGEVKSAVATKTYTKVEPVSLTDFLTTKPASEVILKDLTVIFADGKNTYVVDEDGVALVMYDASKTYYDGTLTAGKVLSGQKATYTAYKNQDEIVPTNAVVATDGVAPVPTLMNAAPTEAQVNKYISFKNVAAALETDSKYYIFDGAIQLYGASTTLNPEADGNYDLAGILINYNGTQLELIVTSLEKGTATAIDNTEAGVKATKVLRDGQLLIEKNGVLYNAQGAVVR